MNRLINCITFMLKCFVAALIATMLFPSTPISQDHHQSCYVRIDLRHVTAVVVFVLMMEYAERQLIRALKHAHPHILGTAGGVIQAVE